ncbi:hypothetical protein KBI52_15330 [Microvirga sp. HBU67558]|uniref:hypothetical protein n=1 Tax=Microvirga TaxID=186650 RepID=UPI001B395D4C|nr:MULTISPECIES: hypothetical protein [unclassified Microvirga]MBQ0821571.1 hypothetical protein [Microvirga sp. HBU67558]
MEERFETCAQGSRRASPLRVEHQQRLQRCRRQIALARALLAQPVYPYDSMAPHDPFDLRGAKAKERA